MKLLFDENLSPELSRTVGTIYPESRHLREVGLRGATDEKVWEFAAANGYAIVTKDDDFRELSALHGPPPKLVMIQLGNCSTSDIEQLLRNAHAELERFGTDAISSMMVLP